MSAASRRTRAVDLESLVLNLLVGQEPLSCRQALYLMASIGAMAKEAEDHKLTTTGLLGVVGRLTNVIDRLSKLVEARHAVREPGARSARINGRAGRNGRIGQGMRVA